VNESRKIFVSWSLGRSRAVAVILKEYLGLVFTECEVFMSEQDIDSGTIPMERIRSELDSSSCGIIVVTPENQSRPWLHFEAGNLFSRFDQSTNRVVPLLVDFQSPTDLEGPLSQLQANILDKDGLARIVESLSRAFSFDSRLKARLADTLWGEFGPRLLKPSASSPPAPKRSTDDKVDEILALIRTASTSIPWITRPRSRPRSENATVVFTDSLAHVLVTESGYVWCINRSVPGMAVVYLDPRNPFIADSARQAVEQHCSTAGLVWQEVDDPTGTGEFFLVSEAPTSEHN
jgi:TIR domain